MIKCGTRTGSSLFPPSFCIRLARHLYSTPEEEKINVPDASDHINAKSKRCQNTETYLSLAADPEFLTNHLEQPLVVRHQDHSTLVPAMHFIIITTEMVR